MRRSEDLGRDGTEIGIAVLLGLALAVPGEALKAGVLVTLADDRADQRAAIHRPGQLGQQLADFNAGDVGKNRRELAPDFGGRIRFEVERVLVRQATRQVDHDDRFA